MSKRSFLKSTQSSRGQSKTKANRKTAKLPSAKGNKKYRTLKEHKGVGLFRTTPGPKGKFLEVNLSLVVMLGYKNKAEILRIPVSHCYQNSGDRQQFSRKLSEGGLVHHEELSLRRKDGSPLIVSETAIAVRDPNGKILYFEGIVEDITERKKSEKQFDIQKTYLEKLFNVAPEAIVLHNNSDRIVDVNDEFTKVFGYSREEAIGRPINDLVAPEELLEEATDVSRRVLQGERIQMETKRKREDGTRIDVSILGAPIFHEGKQIGDYAIYRDITARKKAEEELRVQKTYLESLLNSAPEAIVFHDTNDIVVDVNEEFLKMFGYSREEALGKPINSLVASDEFKGEAAVLSDKVIHGKLVEAESKRRRKDGTLIDVSILGAPIFHEGKQMGVYAIYRDISERKKAEKEIHLQKTYFERLFNSAPEAILLHDNKDGIININDEFIRMFGYSLEEAIGRSVNELVAPQEYIEEAARFSRMSFRGERVEAESKRKRKDGTLMDVSILGAPVFYEGKQIGVYAIYRDITERKKAEEARIRANAEARMARNIQMNFLPKSNPDIPGYEMAGKSLPAMNVGGDYYDFIPLDNHRIAIGLGDVSGNGLAASLVMANLQATIRSMALSDPDPAKCLELANKLLFDSTDARTFVSIFYGILDTQKNTLCYANAGQDMPILFSSEKRPTPLATRGIALGLTEDATYESKMTEICVGDSLLLFTDGIHEAMNGQKEEFGENRLEELVLRSNENPASFIVDKIFDAVSAHADSGSQTDDMTAVLLKRKS